MLSCRSAATGAVARISAPDIEGMVIAALRHLPNQDDGGSPLAERDLVERHVERVVVRPQAIEVHLRSESATEEGTH
jgi:hypothetical protein